MQIHDDDQDRLIDVLLREELGAERPPNLAARILAKAFDGERVPTRRLEPVDGASRFRRLGIHPALAAAALVFVIVSAFITAKLLQAPEPPRIVEKPKSKKVETPLPEQEPEPEPERAIVQTEPPKTGTPVEVPKPPEPVVADRIIRTDDKGKSLELGGFCKVELGPRTTVENKGDGAEQRLALLSGALYADVDRSKGGKFDVETALGTVRVKGTKFKVRLGNYSTERREGEKRDGPDKHAGADKRDVPVKKDGPDKRREGDKHGDKREAERREIEKREIEKREAEKREAARREAEKREGEVREADKPDGEKPEAEKPDGEKREDEKREDSKLTVKVLSGSVVLDTPWGETLIKEGREGGSMIGTLVKKTKDAIFVVPDGEKEPRGFVPQWRGGMPHDGGGADKNMLEKIAGLTVGKRVKLVWVFDEHDRVMGVIQDK